MYRKLICFCISLLIFSASLFGQSDEFIRGFVIDKKNNEPIAFANIRIKDRALGIISNIDGSFKIPLKYKDYGDIIEISSMGYQTQEILIQDFSIYELNNVRLQPAILELEEAIVSARKKRRRKLSAREIVKKAIDRLLENSPTNPYSQIGYYRDYQIDNEAYVNLNEGIFEVFDQGFKATDSSTTKVLIYDYKENTDFERDTLARMPYDYDFKEGAKIIDNGFLKSYGGNEFTILRVHNAIRNYNIDSHSFVHRFDSDLLKEHKFYFEEDSFISDEVLYKIRFEKSISGYTAHGVLFISKSDFAIHKLEYAVYDRLSERKANSIDKAKNKNQLMFEVNTSYQRQGDKMYLNYISFHNSFKLWEPPKLRLNFVEIRHDMSTYFKVREQFVKRRWFILTFNNFLSANQIQNIDQFSLYFKGKKITLAGFSVSDDKVILYPKTATRRQILLMNEIEDVANDGGLNEETFKVKAKGIKDVDGNSIGQWTTKDYHQFREFFVQRIEVKGIPSQNADFMFNDKPIFDGQPMKKPENFKDYWMNTPLQNIKN
ncbi:carboxypeptidase-like regulatory domain-containing protein [Maribacter sp. 2308TA10-17]|uniref:carboxypeptidase-like regulatory domain-containing protein n=1 Tax=Maribacter sp. 2308TA10-17 TaxID=3386276 RepID=UPI0039BD0095